MNEFADADVTPVATSVPEITLADEQGGDSLQTFVLFDGNEDVLVGVNNQYQERA